MSRPSARLLQRDVCYDWTHEIVIDTTLLFVIFTTWSVHDAFPVLSVARSMYMSVGSVKENPLSPSLVTVAMISFDARRMTVTVAANGIVEHGRSDARPITRHLGII